jgi:hypothetical protein
MHVKRVRQPNTNLTPQSEVQVLAGYYRHHDSIEQRAILISIHPAERAE